MRAGECQSDTEHGSLCVRGSLCQLHYMLQTLVIMQVSANLTVDMAAYLSGDQHAGGQEGPASGAYIFR